MGNFPPACYGRSRIGGAGGWPTVGAVEDLSTNLDRETTMNARIPSLTALLLAAALLAGCATTGLASGGNGGHDDAPQEMERNFSPG